MNLIAACLLLGLVSCQLDCDLPTDNIANVIGLTFQSQPEITLRNVRHVCRAFSEERGRYRFVSFLAEYTCTRDQDCPVIPVTHQFESACVDGNWTNMVEGSTTTRTQFPIATFSTELREDCAFCFSPQLATSITAPPPDEETHCICE